METNEKARLIVILPEALINMTRLSYRVHWLAARDERGVLYLVVRERDSSRDALAVARDMTTMSAVTAGNFLPVEWQATEAANLLVALREVCRPGDEIACTVEHQVSLSRQKSIPAIDLIKHKYDGRVHLLAGFTPEKTPPARRWLRGAAVWLGFLAILALFSVLEVVIDQRLAGSLAKVLVLVLMCVEFGSFWAWNRLWGGRS